LSEQDVGVLVRMFNGLFIESEGTELITGADEPIYLPRSETGGLNQIISTRDYFSSVLHEVSHWCIAGRERRKLVDFGYWYVPDGRSEAQQLAFERVEVKPQALEWLFTEACGLTFRLSVDNTAQPELGASEEFRHSVVSQAHCYLADGIPSNALTFIRLLLEYYRPNCLELDKKAFTLSRLG